MTDTLKPAELDLEALKKVALGATPGAWYRSGGRSDLYDGKTPLNGHGVCVEGSQITIAHVFFDKLTGEGFGDANHIATFSPATVLSLLTRIEALEAERDEARARLRNVPGLTPFNDAEDAAWPLAMARLQNTEPGPDQGIAMVGTGDLELALRRLSQFADVALRNAAVIGGLEARALSAEAQRDRMREALTALRNRVYLRTPSERWHLFQQAVGDADAALSQGTGGSSGAGEA
jgi:hypothetical protein